MKLNKVIIPAICVCVTLLFSPALKAQQESNKVFTDGAEAQTAFIHTDSSMKNLFARSYGYAIFPKIGKGGLIVGGATGNGAVYEKGEAIGTAKLIQVSVGLQAGGQTYREVIFFENEEAMDRFKENKIEFSGQASAVAAKSNASANAKYTDGVQVYTQAKNGLMAEASVGGQKFTYKPL